MSSKLKPAKQNSQDGTGRTFASVARTPTAGRADAKPSTPGKAVKKTNANGKYLEVLAEVDNNKNYDGVSTHADADADPILPIVPANTSSNGTPVVTTPSKVAVADVLGHGWKSTSISTFPPTEFATFPAYKDANGTTGDGPVTPPRGHAATEVSGNGLGNVFGNATNTSNGTNGLGLCLGFGNGSSPPVFGNAGAYDGSRMRHHARSPSMPDLRRDGLRDVLGADPFGPYSPSPDRAALALQRLHLVPQPEVKVATAANAPKVKTQREEEDQWFTPRGFQYTNDHSPPTAPSILATPVTPVAALTAVGDSATDLYEDVGEGRNIYLSDLPLTVTEAVLRKIGQSFGRIVSIKIAHGGDASADAFNMLPEGAVGNGNRTYAFVMFDAPLAAEKFMKHLTDNHVPAQYGKETPHLKQKALEDPHSSNLYVAEIPLDTTEDEVRKLFYPGVISSLRFLTDDQGNRRGTAMVRLQSRAQAEEAIRRLDLNVIMRGCSRSLQVRIADSENQKLLKKQTPRSSEPDLSRLVPASPSPPRVLLPTTCLQDLSHSALVEQANAYHEELRRRTHRQSSTVLRSAFQAAQIGRQHFSNDYPSPAAPTFDPASRRGSSDSQDVLQGLLLPGRRQSESSLPPLTPMSLGRKYDPPMARLAQRPALDVSIGRAEYTPTKTSFTAQSIWDSETDSHKFVLGSNTSAASSYTSRHSFLPF